MNKILFLPQDYQAPKSSNFYMKLQDGENKFRILTQPVFGWEDWIEKKPVRYQFHEKPLKPSDAKKPVKHFWSMVVWNYTEEEIQILHITQASIRSSIEALSHDSDWGSPYFYDIKIIRKGEGMDTEYMVNPLPHKKLGAHIVERFNERPCNLDALFHNEDPFAKDSGVFTPGIFSEGDMKEADISGTSKIISEIQVADLQKVFDECDKTFREVIMKSIKREFKATSLSQIPLQEYERVKKALVNNMQETHARQNKEFKESQLEAVK